MELASLLRQWSKLLGIYHPAVVVLQKSKSSERNIDLGSKDWNWKEMYICLIRTYAYVCLFHYDHSRNMQTRVRHEICHFYLQNINDICINIYAFLLRFGQ